MATEIVTFEQKVKERLDSIILDLLPQERMEEMVKAAIVKFEKDTLPKVIEDIVRTRVNAVAQQALSGSDFFSQTWTVMGPEAGPVLQKYMIDAAPLMFAKMMSFAAAQALQDLKNQMQRY